MSGSKSAAAACVLQGWSEVRISAARAGVADVIDCFLRSHQDRAYTATELCDALALSSNEVSGALKSLLLQGVAVREDDAYAFGSGTPVAAQVSGRPRVAALTKEASDGSPDDAA